MKRPCLLTVYFKPKGGEIIKDEILLTGINGLRGTKSPIEEMKREFESIYGEVEIVDSKGRTAQENGYHRADTKQIYLTFWLKEVGTDEYTIRECIKTTPSTALRDSDELLFDYQSRFHAQFEFVEV